MQKNYKEFTLTVLGEPVGQGRPRFSTRGGFVKAYDPKKSRDEKANIKALATQKVLDMHWDILHKDIPAELTVRAYKSIPSSKPTWFKKAAKNKLISPVSKPDGDNILKAVMDSLSGVVYADDKQIYKINYESCYDEQPRVEIEVKLYYVDIGQIKTILKSMGELAAVRTKKNGRSIL